MCVRPHVFASQMLLGELHLDEGLHRGEEPPPLPVLHPTVLLNVLLDAADRQILDLNTGRRSAERNANTRKPLCVFVLDQS